MRVRTRSRGNPKLASTSSLVVEQFWSKMISSARRPRAHDRVHSSGTRARWLHEGDAPAHLGEQSRRQNYAPSIGRLARRNLGGDELWGGRARVFAAEDAGWRRARGSTDANLTRRSEWASEHLVCILHPLGASSQNQTIKAPALLCARTTTTINTRRHCGSS